MLKNIVTEKNARFATKFVVARSVGFMVGRTISSNCTLPEDGFAEKAQLAIGGVALTSIVRRKTDGWVDTVFDETIASWHKMKEELNNDSEE